MAIISLIAAIDTNNGLGKNNQLLCHLPADLKHFKNLTMGKPIIMGRHTYESIGRPLPGRLNIILTHKKLQTEGVQIAHSFEQALELTSEAAEIMVIGGAAVYEETLIYADRLYLTLIHHYFEADVFFPKIDKSLWHCKNQSSHSRDDKNPYDLTFYHYERIIKSSF